MFQAAVGNRTQVFTATEYTNGDTPRLGDLEYDPDYKTFFRYLKNSGATSIAAQLVAMSLTTGKSAYTVTLAATTDALIPFAGVRVPGATTVAQNEQGWFQVGGQATFSHGGGQATAAEEGIVSSATTAGTVEGGAPTVATVASQAGVFAIAEAAVSTAVDCKGSIIRCVFGA